MCYQFKMRVKNDKNNIFSQYSEMITFNNLKRESIDSQILNLKQTHQIYEWLSHKKIKNFKLLFRASQHGFDAQTFHEKCDNQGL